MQSEVIRAPNGRVITNNYIAVQYSNQNSVNDSGNRIGAKPKSSTLLPAISPYLMEVDVAGLNRRISRLFTSRMDPCFIETVKNELYRDYGHVPDNLWLRGLSLRTKTQWDLFYYYLTVRLLSVPIAHEFNIKPTFKFDLDDMESGLDRRAINGFKNAISSYIVPDSAIEVRLYLNSSTMSSGLEIKTDGQIYRVSINTIDKIVAKVDINLGLQLIRLYLNDVLFKSNLVITRSSRILLSVILFMAVVILSPKIGNVGQ